MKDELDKVAEVLHELFLNRPAAYVWELEDGAELITDIDEIHPGFRKQLIPLYTREQIERALGEQE